GAHVPVAVIVGRGTGTDLHAAGVDPGDALDVPGDLRHGLDRILRRGATRQRDDAVVGFDVNLAAVYPVRGGQGRFDLGGDPRVADRLVRVSHARRHVAVRVRIRLIVAGSHAVGIARTGTVAACGCAGHGGGWRRIGGVIVLAAACADHGESQSEGDGGEQSLGLVAESVH